MALEPGTRLGPYEIVELRGKGGMGEAKPLIGEINNPRMHRVFIIVPFLFS